MATLSGVSDEHRMASVVLLGKLGGVTATFLPRLAHSAE